MSKVIILHGTGRSGTTLLNNLLVNHPSLTWFSNYQLLLKNCTAISTMNRLVKYSVDLNDKKRNKFAVHACNEPYAFWEMFYPGLSEANVNSFDEKYRMNNYIDKICYFSGKKNFITKITGFSRAAILDHAFKDYKVVWIDRDPKAVILSMMKLKWFYRKKNIEFERLSVTEKTEFYAEKYLDFYKSKFEIPQSKRIDVLYEDLINSPKDFFDILLPQINLPFSSEFMKIISNWKINPINHDYYEKLYSKEDWKKMKSIFTRVETTLLKLRE